MKLYSALEESFVRIFRRVVVVPESCMCELAVLRVCGEAWGSSCVRISRAVFCKIDVISEFAVSAKDYGEIFFPWS